MTNNQVHFLNQNGPVIIIEDDINRSFSEFKVPK